MDERRSPGGPSLQAGPVMREEERKQVTVVFADLTGSTALAERLDAEDLRSILTSFFNALASVIQRYGGTVDKYAGDAVMAVFGAPLVHEDDAERAVRASLDMQEAIAELNKNLERDRGVRLALRVGVNTGAVVAGPIAGTVQSAYTVVGDAVNTAQRLQSAAPPGGILVGPITRRLADRAFSFERLEPLRVKGRTEPVVAFRVVGPRASPRETPPLRSPLVGRGAELAALLGGVDAVARGEGRIALITGDAGLGKSRLLAEVKRARSGDVVWALEGRALSITQGMSYGPFIEIARRDARIADDEPEAASALKFERRIRDLFGEEADSVVPFLASLVGLPLRGELAERIRYLDAQAIGQQIFASARRYVARLAAERPVILIFEDWHWADESSAALLEHLLPLVETERLGICVASRPDNGEGAVARLRERGERDHAARFIEVRLAPLAGSDSEQLARNLLASKEIPPDLGALVLAKAEGNPFFVEELMRTLIDLGAIVYDRQRAGWRTTDALERITIPDTVQGLLVAHIDRLDEDVKQVLKVASVIGRAFLYRLLSVLARAAETLDVALAELQHVDLIRERSRIPELEYIFKHALVHDAAYESILLQRRKELHALAGEAIERLFTERIEEFYGVLAYHFARAERWEKAQDYLFKAAERAEKIAGDAEALAHYRQAVAAYAKAFGDRWDPLQRATIERRMGEAMFRRGHYLEAGEYLDRALALLGLPMPRTSRGVRLALVRELLRQVGHRRLPRLFVGRRHDPAPEEWARALEVSGWIDWFAQPERLALDAARLLNLAEANHYSLGIAYGSMGLGVMCDAFALTKIASGYYRRAVEVAERIDHPLAIGLAYSGLGYHEHHALGDSAAALGHYHVAIEAYRSAGDVRWTQPATQLSGMLCFQGDFDASLALGHEIAKAGDDIGGNEVKVRGWLSLGSAYARAGDLAAAEDYLRRAIELARVVPNYQSIVASAGYLGECLVRGERIDEAVTVLEEADGIVRKLRLRTRSATATRNALAQAYLAAAERGDRERWFAKARNATRAALAHAKLDREALSGAYRWSGSYAWLRGDRAEAREWWDRSAAVAESLGGRPDLELTRLERNRLERT
ncbi:MAG: AAA family ATPase [Chloroflexota bacterium]|nr:AAA family ATPase [Chloroflexota bacterium]